MRNVTVAPMVKGKTSLQTEWSSRESSRFDDESDEDYQPDSEPLTFRDFNRKRIASKTSIRDQPKPFTRRIDALSPRLDRPRTLSAMSIDKTDQPLDVETNITNTIACASRDKITTTLFDVDRTPQHDEGPTGPRSSPRTPLTTTTLQASRANLNEDEARFGEGPVSDNPGYIVPPDYSRSNSLRGRQTSQTESFDLSSPDNQQKIPVSPLLKMNLSDERTAKLHGQDALSTSKPQVKINYFLTTSRSPTLCKERLDGFSLKGKTIETLFAEIADRTSRTDIRLLIFQWETYHKVGDASVYREDEQGFQDMIKAFGEDMKVDIKADRNRTFMMTLEPNAPVSSKEQDALDGCDALDDAEW